MLGYDYEIIYENGKDNVVVDVVSQQYEDEGSLFTLSSLILDWLKKSIWECLIHTSIS